jgi:hypothetical protein
MKIKYCTCLISYPTVFWRKQIFGSAKCVLSTSPLIFFLMENFPLSLWGLRYLLFSLFPRIFWVICSHVANSQIWNKHCRSSFSNQQERSFILTNYSRTEFLCEILLPESWLIDWPLSEYKLTSLKYNNTHKF